MHLIAYHHQDSGILVTWRATSKQWHQTMTRPKTKCIVYIHASKTRHMTETCEPFSENTATPGLACAGEVYWLPCRHTAASLSLSTEPLIFFFSTASRSDPERKPAGAHLVRRTKTASLSTEDGEYTNICFSIIKGDEGMKVARSFITNTTFGSYNTVKYSININLT